MNAQGRDGTGKVGKERKGEGKGKEEGRKRGGNNRGRREKEIVGGQGGEEGILFVSSRHLVNPTGTGTERGSSHFELDGWMDDMVRWRERRERRRKRRREERERAEGGREGSEGGKVALVCKPWSALPFLSSSALPLRQVGASR